MEIRTAFIIGLMFSFLASCSQEEEGKHMFILSGQSNMAGLKPEESFTPAVENEFGKENVIVVKHAQGGQPIRRWFRDWQPPHGTVQDYQPDLYDSLMVRVKQKIENEKIATVTFIWMQGERDGREELGLVYEQSLVGLYNQLRNDLYWQDMNFVIGRLSDFDLKNEKYPHWTMIREIQVKVAESNPRFDWVNTDDLNDGLNRKGEEISNDLHMSAEGYEIMGERFAEKAIELIRENK